MNQDVVIMENIIMNKNQSVIFDLKGSKVDRLVKGIENSLDPPLGIVLKDENFIQYNRKIIMEEEKVLHLIDILRKDFAVLKENNVIDYSVLLSICKKPVPEIELNKFSFIDDNGVCFSIGIIDIFQEYNFLKASEKAIKTIFNKGEEISIAKPSEYFNRISEYITSIFAQ